MQCNCSCHRWDSGVVTHDQPCCDWSLEKNIRPWGRYDILWDGDDCKVKRITVSSGGKLSYQYHHKRAEDWIIISGNAMVTIDDNTFSVHAGERIHIAKTRKHRIENRSDEDVVFVEVQTGDYFGEDDIVRLEDSYGRK